jgi:hypothetical protein
VPVRAWLAAALLIALAGCVALAVWALGTADRDLARADRLWGDGARASAVQIYLEYPQHFWKANGSGCRGLCRVVEYQLDHGDTAEARAWLERAAEHGIDPGFKRSDAAQLYTEVRQEHDRRRTAEEEQKRQREQEAEHERRRPQEQAEEDRRIAERKALLEQEEKDRALLEDARRRQKEREQKQAEDERRRKQEDLARRQAELDRLDAKAAPHLRYARELLDRGETAKAAERLREIVDKYSGTPSAEAARRILIDLGK